MFSRERYRSRYRASLLMNLAAHILIILSAMAAIMASSTPVSTSARRQLSKWLLHVTISHPEIIGDMSRVTLNFDLSKIPFVHFLPDQQACCFAEALWLRRRLGVTQELLRMKLSVGRTRRSCLKLKLHWFDLLWIDRFPYTLHILWQQQTPVAWHNVKNI